MSIEWTILKKAEFLTALSESCNVTKSCEAVGISRSGAYLWREEDPAFAKKWEAAKVRAIEALEDEAHRRAFDGCAKPTKYGMVREFSDTLAIFLLKAHCPEKYAERTKNENSNFNLDGSDTEVAAQLDAIHKAAAQRRKQQESADDGSDLV